MIIRENEEFKFVDICEKIPKKSIRLLSEQMSN